MHMRRYPQHPDPTSFAFEPPQPHEQPPDPTATLTVYGIRLPVDPPVLDVSKQHSIGLQMLASGVVD